MNFKIDIENRVNMELSQFKLNSNLDWLIPIKTNALEKFKTSRLPNRKIEHWKYNEMSFLKESLFSICEFPNKELVADQLENSTQVKFESALELIVVDGYLVSDLNNLQSIEGLTFTKFESTNLEQQKKILEQTDIEFNSKNLLINLNEALCSNGIFIEIEKDKTIDRPIYIRHFSSNNKNSTLSSQKTVFSIGQSSQISIIEEFQSTNESENQLSLQQTSIKLSENSIVNHYRLNFESENIKQVSQVKKVLGKNCTINDFYLGFGSALNRTDIDILHKGINAEANITGIYLPKNKQAIDYHTNIEHQVAHCNSTEIFRGIIADEASATFNGKIHIFQDAQKSNAYLNNKNLLLTNQAEINTKPELEIYADDVVCAHGATVAQLDKKAMYYLQSRGINQQQAKKILSVAFVQELLNKIKIEPIKTYLSEIVSQHMSKIK